MVNENLATVHLARTCGALSTSNDLAALAAGLVVRSNMMQLRTYLYGTKTMQIAIELPNDFVAFQAEPVVRKEIATS